MKTDEEIIAEYRAKLAELNVLAVELYNRKCAIMLSGSASGYLTNLQRGVEAHITKKL